MRWPASERAAGGFLARPGYQALFGLHLGTAGDAVCPDGRQWNPPRTAGSPAQWSCLRRLQSVELWRLCLLSGRLRWSGAVLELRALPPERESRGYVGLTARAATQTGLQTRGKSWAFHPPFLPTSSRSVPRSQAGPPHLSQGSRSGEQLDNAGVFFILFSRRHLPKCTQNLPLFFSLRVFIYVPAS